MTDFDTTPLILYDGECGLCNASVQWICRHSLSKAFYFAPLQGHTARLLPTLNKDLDSMVVFFNGQYYYESEAAIFIAKRLQGIPKLLGLLGIVPLSIRNKAYRFVSQHRIHWFGKAQYCQLPQGDRRTMFLT